VRVDHARAYVRPPYAPLVPPTNDPWKHRRGEPRTFAAAWLLYMCAALVITLGAGGALGLVGPEVYRPLARSLVLVLACSIWIVWPMLRLSQAAPRHPRRSFFADWAVIMLPAQAIVWPQSLAWMAGWPTSACAALSLWLAAWGALAAAILTLFFAHGGNARTLTMLAFIAVGFMAPAAWLLAGSEGGLLPLLSPLSGAVAIVADRSDAGAVASVPAHGWTVIAVVGAVAAVAWLASLVAAPGRPEAAADLN
jgi:hypothetical protein